MGWSEFLVKLNKEPKKFAKFIVDELNPPKYAIQSLRDFEWICDTFECWTPRIDACFNCHSSVCEEHGKLILGPKTKLEWRICPSCQNNMPMQDLLEKIHAEDEEFWLEDQDSGDSTQ